MVDNIFGALLAYFNQLVAALVGACRPLKQMHFSQSHIPFYDSVLFDEKFLGEVLSEIGEPVYNNHLSI